MQAAGLPDLPPASHPQGRPPSSGNLSRNPTAARAARAAAAVPGAVVQAVREPLKGGRMTHAPRRPWKTALAPTLPWASLWEPFWDGCRSLCSRARCRDNKASVKATFVEA